MKKTVKKVVKKNSAQAQQIKETTKLVSEIISKNREGVVVVATPGNNGGVKGLACTFVLTGAKPEHLRMIISHLEMKLPEYSDLSALGELLGIKQLKKDKK